MADKNFNVRVIMKHGKTADWNAAVNFIPKQGEVIVYEDYYKDSNDNPVPGFKVGDGTTKVSALPFVDKRLVEHLGDTTVHYNLGYDETNHMLIFSTPSD